MESKEVNGKSQQFIEKMPARQEKSFRSISKDKLMQGKISNAQRNKLCSKVPRVMRVPLKFNSNKTLNKLDEKPVEQGNNKPSTSKARFPMKINASKEKPKPSLIPRRKSSFMNASKTATTKKEYQFLANAANSRNVQQIQMLINQDFRPEKQIPPASITSTKPIPAMGQFMVQHQVLTTERINDWFLNVDTPANSMATNFFNNSSRLINMPVNAENDVEIADKHETIAVTNVNVTELSSQPLPYPQKPYRSTDENVSEWLSSDIEYPTRDNESGCRSTSLPSEAPNIKESKCSILSSKVGKNSTNIEPLRSNISAKKPSVQPLIQKSTAIRNKPSFKQETVTAFKEQPTVVISKKSDSVNPIESSNTEREKHKTSYKTDAYHIMVECVRNEAERISFSLCKGLCLNEIDFSKNFQYPSNVTCAQAEVERKAVPSYVECPSEVLQKTTNFEADGIILPDSPNTQSSNAGTDLEIRDDLSSQFTLDHEDCSIIDDRCNAEWGHHRCCGREDRSNVSSVVDSLLCQYTNDILDSSKDDSCINSWKRHQAGRHCKKYPLYRRFPSTRYKLSKTLLSLRRRMSLRLCRRRLSKVWKKTTERWALWSAKPPNKFSKLRIMHYLQRAMLEDADVQTNIFVYRETGTESTPKLQKSTCVSTTFKLGSRLSCNGNESGKPASLSSASKSKNSNLGKSSLVEQINQEKLCSGKEKDVDNLKSIAMMCSESHIAQNHIFTQAFSSHFLRDSKHIYGKKGLVKEESIAENFIEISEISTDDKDTGTEEVGCLMQDNVTSTVLHLDNIRQSWESQNVDTQMQIICNNAETDVIFPQTRDLCSTSVLTSLSENAALYKPGETNTEIHDLRSIYTMTIPEMNSSPTETQVTPVPSLKMKSTANFTSNSFRQGLKPAKIDMSTIMDDEFQDYFRDYAIQVMPHMESFLGSDQITKSTSTTAVTVQEAYAVMSMKEFDNNGVSTSKAQVQSANCLTSSSLQACKCCHFDIASQYTNTDDEQNKIITSKNKLESFLNTGVLINSLIQTALSQTRPRVLANSSIGLDTISFGKKYTSEIATCTNSALKGPVIEKENGSYFEILPDKMSINTSTFVNQRSQSTEHSLTNSVRAVAVGGCKMDNCTQYSNMQQEILDTVSCRTERIGNSHLIFVRMLNHSAEETSVQTESAYSNDLHVYTPPQCQCTSVFTSQCALAQSIPTLPDLKDFVHQDIGLTSSLNTNQRKSDFIRNSGFRLDSSEVLSSDLDADKWIKSCIEKGYQSHLEEKYRLNENAITSSSNSSGCNKRRSKSVASATQSESQDVAPKVTALASVITDNNMALEKYDKDLVPTKESSSDKQIVKMVDHDTSDEVVKKDVREIILQASPENVEAATECKQTTLQKSIECIQSTKQKSTECSQVISLKSACVFTSRCILPPPSLSKCHMQNSSFLGADCVFVYGKPKCVIHAPEEPIYTTEKGHSRHRAHVFPVSNTTYDFTKYQEQRFRSMGVLSSSTAITSSCNKSKMMSPKEYEALYEKRLCEEAKIKRMKKLYKVYGIDAEVEARMFHASGMQSISMVTTPADVRSAAAFTSQCKCCPVVKNDQIQMTQVSIPGSNPIYSFVAQSKETGSAETSGSQSVKMLEIPTHDDDPEDSDEFKEESDKAYLVGCRYYSTLLSKQLDRVRENITKHLSPFTDSTYEIPITISECTMKPSACEELGCQTKSQPNPEILKYTPILSPAISTTDIGQHDKEYLKSVYYMLTAIEGRLRRFKTNMY